MRRDTKHFALGIFAASVIIAALFGVLAYESASVTVKKLTGETRIHYSIAIGFDPPPVIVNELTFVQLRLDATEIVDTTNFGLKQNGTHDVICNNAGHDIVNLELSVATTVQRVSGGPSAAFVIRGASCLGCIDDPFPQLDDADKNPTNQVLVGFQNPIDLSSIGVTVARTLAENECFGLLIRAFDSSGDGDSLAIRAGTINMYYQE